MKLSQLLPTDEALEELVITNTHLNLEVDKGERY